jgi:hypothetical protein
LLTGIRFGSKQGSRLDLQDSQKQTTTAFQHIGCFSDERKGTKWALPGGVGLSNKPSVHSSNAMQRELCANSCWAQGFKIMGLQGSKDCWCGSSYNADGIVDSSKCADICEGSKSNVFLSGAMEICGGFGVNSVFSLTEVEMDVGRENWLIKQRLKGAKAVDMASSSSSKFSLLAGDEKTCSSSISSDEVGVWNVAEEDGTLHYNLESCLIGRLDVEKARKLLANTHLIFIGDSLTRYQYLSLAHFIERGSYPSRKMVKVEGEPNILREDDFYAANPLGAWKDLFALSSKLLGGRELCDCWRGNETTKSKTKSTTLENRFYSLPSHNLRISYLTYLGKSEVQHGHTRALKSQGAGEVLSEEVYESNSYARNPYDWQPQNVSTAVEDVLASDPERSTRRAVIVWNSGIWGAFKGAKDAEYLKASLLSLKQSAGKHGLVFYKTTTVAQTSDFKRASGLREFDHVARAVVPALKHSGISIYDANKVTKPFESLERAIYMAIYWDGVHFQPYVYEELNNVLLHKLEGMSS